LLGSAFAAFADPGVAVKETAENAIAAATAIMEIVFMFISHEQGFFSSTCAPHPRMQLN
jgi:hypothetical protein